MKDNMNLMNLQVEWKFKIMEDLHYLSPKNIIRQGINWEEKATLGDCLAFDLYSNYHHVLDTIDTIRVYISQDAMVKSNVKVSIA